MNGAKAFNWQHRENFLPSHQHLRSPSQQATGESPLFLSFPDPSFSASAPPAATRSFQSNTLLNGQIPLPLIGGAALGTEKEGKERGGGTAEDTERLGALVPGLRLQAWTSPLDWAARGRSVAATGDSRTGYSGSFHGDLALLERGSEQPLAFLLFIPPPQAGALFFSVFGCAQRNIPTLPP